MKLNQEDLDKQYILPFLSYLDEKFHGIKKKEWEKFALGISGESFLTIARTLMIDAYLPDNADLVYSGNPFKTLFLEIIVEKRKKDPGFFTEYNESLLSILLKAFVLFTFELMDDVDGIANFRDKVEDIEADDPVLDEEFLDKLNDIIRKKRTSS